MSEAKLKWAERVSGKWRVWEASAGGHNLSVWTRADGSGIDGPGDFGWRLGSDAFRQGTGSTLAEAQLEAEAAVLAKLSEGVAALGGRVLTGEQAAAVDDVQRADKEQNLTGILEGVKRLRLAVPRDR